MSVVGKLPLPAPTFLTGGAAGRESNKKIWPAYSALLTNTCVASFGNNHSD